MVKPLPPSPSYLQRPIIPVQYPGKGAGPLFLNQTAVEGSKTTFGDAPPYVRVWMVAPRPPPPPPPPPPPALYLEVWIWHRVQFKF